MTTTRTTPNSKPRTAAASKRPTVHFDVAQAEAEVDAEIEEQYIEPFLVKARNGTIVTLIDPRQLDVFVAATLDYRDPYTTFRQLIEDDEQYAAFVEGGMRPMVAKKFIDGYKEHYKGLTLDLGN